MVPAVVNGRGAFTKVGKETGRFYRCIDGVPFDGGTPERDVNYQAVSLGVKALQRRANEYATMYGFGKVSVDGNYSPLDRRQYRLLQGHLGLYVDGIIGPATCKAIWRDLIIFYADIYNVPPEHVWGMTSLESAFDPGAVGYVTPSDRGLCQINLVAHPAISVEQAFDHHYAFNYTANRLRKARDQFYGQGTVLQRDCSIAQHNSPLAAQQWYKTGTPPTEQIATYVSLVLAQGSGL